MLESVELDASAIDGEVGKLFSEMQRRWLLRPEGEKKKKKFTTVFFLIF